MASDATALVLFSGGQDSTVCLAWALARYDRVETIGFDYGQTHKIELGCRPRIIERLRALYPAWGPKIGADHLLQLDTLNRISDTALTREAEITLAADGLPTTFVPGRNLLFLTYAAALGYRRNIDRLVGGMCETDYSGYPDCRRATLDALEQSLTLGMDRRFIIETPLMQIDKAATWRLAEELGGAALVDLIVEETHSCYRGDHETRHDWGYGCGTCPACQLRARGYEAYRSAHV